jgi:maleylacetoacetate isomerase
VAVNLLDGSSESSEHLKRNPLGYVPVLQIENQGKTEMLIESVAIVEWLDEVFPENPLLPKDPIKRAKTRALVEVINSGTQPIQNLTVVERHSSDENEKKQWMQFFTQRGLAAFETLAREFSGPWSLGSEITMADLFLIPQIYNAHRQDVDLSGLSRINEIYKTALNHPACQQSHPDKYQPKT